MTKRFAVARAHSAISQRQLDVFENRQVADQIEALENESDLAIANSRALRERKIRHLVPFERVTSVRWRVEQAEDRQQRRFAAARRSGDRNVFAVANIEMNAGKRVGLHLVGQKHFRDGVELDQRGRAVPTGELICVED